MLWSSISSIPLTDPVVFVGNLNGAHPMFLDYSSGTTKVLCKVQASSGFVINGFEFGERLFSVITLTIGLRRISARGLNLRDFYLF